MDVTESLRMLYPRLIAGDAGAIAVFDVRATVDSPMWGRQQPAEFLAETRGWLERHAATSEEVHTVTTPERVIHEVSLHVDVDGTVTEVPVMLVADVAGDRVRDLRVYHSTWPLTGKHSLRGPLTSLDYSLARRPPEPVGTYHEALSDADAAAADAVFEPSGKVREPAGGPWEYAGPDRTDWYRMVLSDGPIVLHLATISDDGETVVYEYMADRWGAGPMPAQSGAAAYQRGPSGLLCSARIYDDIEPPAALGPDA
jgi:hypothetical protein